MHYHVSRGDLIDVKRVKCDGSGKTTDCEMRGLIWGGIKCTL